MIARILLAGLLAVTPCAAGADTVALPDETVSDRQREKFRLCRAAIVTELSPQTDKRTVLPTPIVLAMREQIEFVMAETIYGLPTLSLEDGRKRLKFTERFISDVGKTADEETEALADPVKRTAVLLDCQPMLWTIMKQRIDVLLGWRRRALGLDSSFPGNETPNPE